MNDQIEAARQEFLAACTECGTDPVVSENAVLSAGRDLLPPHAMQVLDGGPKTVAYWRWLENEVAAGNVGIEQ